VCLAISTSAVYYCTLCIMFVMLRRSVAKLSLFTPPREIVHVVQMIISGRLLNKVVGGGDVRSVRRAGGVSYNMRQSKRSYRPSFDIYALLRRPLVRIGLIVTGFTGLIGSFVVNPNIALRISVGSAG